jgi:putative endonuclease
VTYTIYVLRCADGSLYTGIARDLEARIALHNRGAGAKYTRVRCPVVLVWKRGRQAPRAARQLEVAIKALPRRDKERLIAGDEALWRQLRRRAVTPAPTKATLVATVVRPDGAGRVTSTAPRQ